MAEPARHRFLIPSASLGGPPQLPVAGSPWVVTRSRPASSGLRAPVLQRPSFPSAPGTLRPLRELGARKASQLASPPLPAPGNHFRGYAPPPARFRFAAEKASGSARGEPPFVPVRATSRGGRSCLGAGGRELALGWRRPSPTLASKDRGRGGGRSASAAARAHAARPCAGLERAAEAGATAPLLRSPRAAARGGRRMGGARPV